MRYNRRVNQRREFDENKCKDITKKCDDLKLVIRSVNDRAGVSLIENVYCSVFFEVDIGKKCISKKSNAFLYPNSIAKWIDEYRDDGYRARKLISLHFSPKEHRRIVKKKKNYFTPSITPNGLG